MGGILHMSDIHFGCENKAAIAAATDIAYAGDFQLIVISGDITQFGHVSEFEAAAAWVATLPAPVLITPGNHDTPYAGMVARAIAPWSRYERYFGAARTSAFDGQGLAVRAFNSARGMQVRLNWSKGAVDPSRVEAAVRDLRGVDPASLRVAVCHHPLMEVVGGPMTGRVRGGRRAAEILAQAGVDVVLSGHVHTAFAVTLPCGDGHTHAGGACTLSMRERGMPPGFNIVEWDEKAVTIKAQAWIGSTYEPLRTWALPRRPRVEAPV
jgi:3',5'-cyclic AMP phosphodiesterase CpdA